MTWSTDQLPAETFFGQVSDGNVVLETCNANVIYYNKPQVGRYFGHITVVQNRWTASTTSSGGVFHVKVFKPYTPNTHGVPGRCVEFDMFITRPYPIVIDLSVTLSIKMKTLSSRRLCVRIHMCTGVCEILVRAIFSTVRGQTRCACNAAPSLFSEEITSSKTFNQGEKVRKIDCT